MNFRDVPENIFRNFELSWEVQAYALVSHWVPYVESLLAVDAH